MSDLVPEAEVSPLVVPRECPRYVMILISRNCVPPMGVRLRILDSMRHRKSSSQGGMPRENWRVHGDHTTSAWRALLVVDRRHPVDDRALDAVRPKNDDPKCSN